MRSISADSSAGARIATRQASPVNPFAGTVFYVNPDYAKNAETSLARVAANSTDAAKIRAVQVSNLDLSSTAAASFPAFLFTYMSASNASPDSTPLTIPNHTLVMARHTSLPNRGS
jgi:hypothetical protein